jgi:hypothetical protein
MKIGKSFFAAAILVGSLAAGGSAFSADGVLLKEQLAGTNYCHLQFPAMTEESLSSNNPSLKSPASGDIIDFYGPCDENPTGKDQVQKQELQNEWRWSASH